MASARQAFVNPPSRKNTRPILSYDGVRLVVDLAAARNAALKSRAIAVVKRDVPRWVVFRCPCGCGELVSVNVDPRAGPSWRMQESRRKLSLVPSVWRTAGCRSHFIIWQNKVWLLRSATDRKTFAKALERQVRGSDLDWLHWFEDETL